MLKASSWEIRWSAFARRLAQQTFDLHPVVRVAPFILSFSLLLQLDVLWDAINSGTPQLMIFLGWTRAVWIPLLLLGVLRPLVPALQRNAYAGLAVFVICAWLGWLKSPLAWPVLIFAMLMLATVFFLRVSTGLWRKTWAFLLVLLFAELFFRSSWSGTQPGALPDRSLFLIAAPITWLALAVTALWKRFDRESASFQVFNPSHLISGTLFPGRLITQDLTLTGWTLGLMTALMALPWITAVLILESWLGPAYRLCCETGNGTFQQRLLMETASLFSTLMSLLAVGKLIAGTARIYGAQLPDPILRPWFAKDPFDLVRRLFVLEFLWSRRFVGKTAGRVFQSPKIGRMVVVLLVSAYWIARNPAEFARVCWVALTVVFVQLVVDRLPSTGLWPWFIRLVTLLSAGSAWVLAGLFLKNL